MSANWQAISRGWFDEFSRNVDSISNLSPAVYDYSFAEIATWHQMFDKRAEALLKSDKLDADSFFKFVEAKLKKVLPSADYRPARPRFDLDRLMQWMDLQSKRLATAATGLPIREQQILKGIYGEWQLNLRSQLLTQGLVQV